jgi:hypothetical protein
MQWSPIGARALLSGQRELRLLAGRGDVGHCRWQVTHDLPCLDTKDAIARACELAISADVSARATGVIAAIHFDDQLNAWCEKIYDEAEQWHLPPERNAEPA